MATTTMNISLPDSMRDFVETALNNDGYGSASEYVRELIRADQKRREQQRLEKVLLERLSSNENESFTMDDIRAAVRRRLEAGK